MLILKKLPEPLMQFALFFKMPLILTSLFEIPQKIAQ